MRRMWTMDPVVAAAFTILLLEQTLPFEGKRTAKVLALGFLKYKAIARWLSITR